LTERLFCLTKTLTMEHGKRPTLPRGLRWDPRSPHICISWRDERGRQHQQSTHTDDPAKALAFRQDFKKENRDAIEERRARAADQSRLPLGDAARMKGGELYGDAEQRLRFAFQLVRMLAEREDPTVIQSWLTGLNPELGDRVPLRLMRENDLETVAPEIMGAARAFLVGG